MTREERYAVNLATYRAIKDSLSATYPRRQFVAIAEGRVVADDADFMALRDKLLAQGLDPFDTLIERVGDEPLSGGSILGVPLQVYS